MKTIYVMSPSGVVFDESAFRHGVACLKSHGFNVIVDENALSIYQRFAGTDDERIAAFQRAVDSGAEIVLFARGGYGMTRILASLPWDSIIKANQQWVGFSDLTAFQMAALTKGFKTYAGPMLMADFSKDCVDNQYGFSQIWSQPSRPISFKTDVMMNCKEVGTLWGGNLAMLMSIFGTSWFPDIRDGFLFLEDVAEAPYRVERMMWQLAESGVLGRQKAIILGQFTGYKLSVYDRGYELDTVIDYMRTLTNVPIITGLPFGHEDKRAMLRQGAQYQLRVDGLNVSLKMMESV